MCDHVRYAVPFDWLLHQIRCAPRRGTHLQARHPVEEGREPFRVRIQFIEYVFGALCDLVLRFPQRGECDLAKNKCAECEANHLNSRD